MASITGSIPLTNFIAPNSSADSYPITKPIYGLGGLRTVGSTGERDAITSARREAGMVVYVADIQKYYTFKGPTGNGDWTEFVLGSSGGSTGATGAKGTTGAGYLSGSGQEIDISELVIGNSYPITVSTTPAPAYSFGQTLLIVDDLNVTNYFIGTVTNWASATNIVTLTITEINGSGTSTSWTLNLVGPRGSNGSIGATGVTGLAGDIYKSIGTAGITLASIGSGVTLTVPSGLAYSKVQTVLVAAGACQYFIGTVNTYSGVTLSLIVNSVTGTAFSNVWDVNLNGAVGQKGDPGIQGPTGSPGASGPYVISVNGATGIVENVAKTNITNSFDLTQTFSSGFQSSQDVFVQNIVFGRGGSGGSTNLTIGANNNTNQTTTSFGNLSIGNSSLATNETGGYNLAIGTNALEDIETPFFNTALGHNSLKNIVNTSDNNLAIGFNAGANRGIAGAFQLTSANNSMFIGNNARPLANASTNELVIGYNAVGLGNNSTVIGNTSITNARIYGLLDLPNGISASNIINSINGLTGAVTLSAGNNMGIGLSGNSIIFSSTGACGSCGPIILDNTVFIRGVCGNSDIRIDPSSDNIDISSPKFISVGTNGLYGPPVREAYIQTDGAAGTLLLNGVCGISIVGNVTQITGNLVNRVNGLTGMLSFAAGTGISFGISGNTLTIISTVSGSCVGVSAGVQSLNGISGTVGLSAGTSISITSTGNTLSIANTGVLSLTGATGISLTGSTGNIIITNTGVNDLTASTGISISGAKIGALTISNTGVLSINSETGVVTNVAKTNLANIFTFNQAITKKAPKLTLTDTDELYNSLLEANQISFTSPFATTQTWLPSNVPSTITFPGSTGTLALTSGTVSRVNGLTGTVGLSAGTGMNITKSGNTLIISSTGIGNTGATGNTGPVGPYVISINGLSGGITLAAGTGISITPSGNTLTIATTNSGGSGDGSALISRLYPKLPQNGLCAGDIISYNGSNTWIPTPREYLVTPSIWQTKPTTAGTYPASIFTTWDQDLLIAGSSGGNCPVGELIQLQFKATAGVTLTPGTWWLNYSAFENNDFSGSYSGLKIYNVNTFLTGTVLAGSDQYRIAGFAMLIRGNTYNAFDGRGGPYGNTLCSQNPNTMPLGDNSACDGDGVVDYPVVCTPRYGQGFTYGGEFYVCVNV